MRLLRINYDVTTPPVKSMQVVAAHGFKKFIA